MSLARNPNMPYVAAGRQDRPFERMGVRSNVSVPSADVSADCDGRPSYLAPEDIAREPFRIPFKAVVILVALAMFALSMVYLSFSAKRSSMYKEGQAIYNEMRDTEKKIIVLKEKLAKAQEPNALCYRASQLTMIDSKGAMAIKNEAPDAQPAEAEFSLSADNSRASMQ